MKVRVGSCPDSWGVWFPSDDQQIPWRRFLDEIVEAGYQATELGPYGYLPTDIPTLRRELESRRLTGIVAIGENCHGPDAFGKVERSQAGGRECRPGRPSRGLHGGKAGLDALADHKCIARVTQPHRAATAGA